MNKELLEMLKDLNGVLEDMLEDNKDSFKSKLQERITKGFEEKAILSIEKKENGEAITKIEGTNIGVLIALAGLEKSVLEKLNPPKGLWKLIKDSVGTKEVNNG